MGGRKKNERPRSAPEHAWERLADEPDSAWESFAAYRDMGPGLRSQGKLVQKFSKAKRNFGDWSTRWDWVSRCHAYDQWYDRETKRAEIEEVKEMRRRHIQMAMSFQGAAALALNKIIAAEKQKVIVDGKEVSSPLTLKPSEVKDLAELGIRIERLNRELPSDVTEQRVEQTATVSHDYTGLSLTELRQLKTLVGKAKK